MSEALGQFVQRKTQEFDSRFEGGEDGGNSRAVVISLAAIRRFNEELVSRLGFDTLIDEQQQDDLESLYENLGEATFVFAAQFFAAEIPSGS